MLRSCIKDYWVGLKIGHSLLVVPSDRGHVGYEKGRLLGKYSHFAGA